MAGRNGNIFKPSRYISAHAARLISSQNGIGYTSDKAANLSCQEARQIGFFPLLNVSGMITTVVRKELLRLFLTSILLLFFRNFTIHAQTIQSNDLNKQLIEGKIIFSDIQDGSVQGIEATFLLHISPAKLWQIITDYKNYVKNFDNVKKVSVLDENKNGATVELWIPTIIKTFHYTVYRKYEIPMRKLSWNRISGDFETNNGSWEILEIEDKNACLVKYRSFVEVGGFIGNAFKGLTKPESIKRITHMVNKLKNMFER